MSAKLSLIQAAEPVQKVSVTFKESTVSLLHAYTDWYCERMGLAKGSVKVRNVHEQMLLDFMASDKEFMRSRQTGKSMATERPGATPDVTNRAVSASADEGGQV